MQKQRIVGLDLGSNVDLRTSSGWEPKLPAGANYWLKLRQINETYPLINNVSIPSNAYLGYEYTWSDRPKGRYMSDMYHLRNHYRDWQTTDIQFSGSQIAWRRYWRYTDAFHAYRAQFSSVPVENLTQWNHLMSVPSDFSARAWGHLQPRFEGEISMLNFLYELKDLKPLLKYVFNFNFPRLILDMKRVLQSVRTDPSRPIAEAHLVNEFAIKPMISDIGAILGQVYNIVNEAQQQFAESGSQFQKKHFSEKTVIFESTEYCLNTYDSWASNVWRTAKRQTVTYTATLRYKYKYTTRPQWEAFVRYWGLDLNAEAIWNAIPFSFLLDYFIKIGDALHAAYRDENVALTEYEYAESALFKTMSGFVMRPTSSVPYSLLNHKPMISGEDLMVGYNGEIFSRTVTEPNKGIAIPRVPDRISTGKVANIAALVRCFL